MLFLLFYVGNERFVIESEAVLEVVPKVNLQPLSQAPPYIAGLLNIGRIPMPVIDFCSLIEKRRAADSFHTRIMVMREVLLRDTRFSFALMAEKVTDLIEEKDKREPNETYSSCLRSIPYLEKIWTDEAGIIQQVDVEKLCEYLLASNERSYRTFA